MRHAPVLTLLLSLSLVACKAEAPPADEGAAPATEPAVETAGADEATVEGTGVAIGGGTVYGEKFGDAHTVALGALFANPDDYEGKRVRVAGMVTGVCAKRGCWINIGAEEGPDEVLFKVTDGVIVFPMSAQGKWVEAEGTAQKVELNLERTRDYLAHKAEEGGEEFDPATVTEPLTIVRLAGLGAVIYDERPAPTSE